MASRRRHEVFLDVVETASMDLPFLAIGGAGDIAVQAKIQRNEVER